MKTTFISILLSLAIIGSSQKNTFEKLTQDTINLSRPNFNNTVGLVLDEAIVYIQVDFFKQKLYEEWKGCKKTIRQWKRAGSPNSGILKFLPDRLVEAQQAFIGLDSAYKYFKKLRRINDTIYLSYKSYFAKSRFGDFIPNLIENGQCAIADKKLGIQTFIIRQIGWKRNGSFSSGSRLYFLPGHENHFWAKWDWST